MDAMLQLKLEELEDWIKKETTELVEPLKADAKKQLEDVRSKLEDLLEATDKLLQDADKEMLKASRKTYRRAKALYKLGETFTELIEKIVIFSRVDTFSTRRYVRKV